MKKMSKPWSDVLFFAAITLLVYLAVMYILPLVLPFLLAVLFAVLLHPIVKKLENKIRLPRGVLSFGVIAIAVLMIGIPFVVLLTKAVQEFCGLVGGYRDWKGEIGEIWCVCCERVEELTGIRAVTIESWGSGHADTIMTNIQEKVVPFVMECSVGGIKGIAGILWKGLVTIVASVLILADFEGLRRGFFRTQPGRIAGRIGKRIMHAGGTYLKAQGIIWVIISAVCIIGLLLTGNRYAILAGMGIGLCDALPFLGTGIVYVPWLLIKLFQGEYGLAIVYGVLYIVCNIIREFLEPKLVGKSLGVHPLAIIFSLYIGICIFGGTGIVLGPLSVLLIWELYLLRREYDDRYDEERDEG